MKKLYSLIAAAGVSAAACFAASPMEATGSLSLTKSASLTKSDVNYELNLGSSEATAMQKAPANGAPASLDGLILGINYDMEFTDGTELVSNPLTLTEIDRDEESILYNVKGWGAGCFLDTVTLHDVQFVYYPAEGLIEVPAGQTFLTFQGKDFDFWALRDDKYLWSGIPLQLKYQNGAFEMVSQFKVTEDDGTVTDFFMVGFYACTKVEENGQTTLSTAAPMSNFQIDIYDGIMKWTVEGKSTVTGETVIMNEEANIHAYLTDASTFFVEEFAPIMLGVPVNFTVDTKNKTLSAVNVIVGTMQNGDYMYISDCDDDFWPIYKDDNGNGDYKLTATYTVSNGKTKVNVHNWNVFYGTEDDWVFFPISDTTIELNYDLDEAVSGVNNIEADMVDENAPVEYFNLQGIRVANPENGLFIRRQGNKATKVIL